MTKLFSTTLLGLEFAQARIPYENIPGEFHAQDGMFTFWSNGNCILAVPMDNVQRWGSDWSWWRKDFGQKVKQFVIEASTLGFFSLNRFGYNWIVYYDETLGGTVEIWLLVSNGWINEGEADRRHRLIGQVLTDWREHIRRSTRPR